MRRGIIFKKTNTSIPLFQLLTIIHYTMINIFSIMNTLNSQLVNPLIQIQQTIPNGKRIPQKLIFPHSKMNDLFAAMVKIIKW